MKLSVSNIFRFVSVYLDYHILPFEQENTGKPIEDEERKNRQN